MALTTDPIDINLMLSTVGIAGAPPETTILSTSVADPAQGLNAARLGFSGDYAVLTTMSDSAGLGGNTYVFPLWLRSDTPDVVVSVLVTD